MSAAITITAATPLACGSSNGYYSVTFTLNGLPPLSTNPDMYGEGENARYAIFWYFGDGTHVETIVSGSASSTSCQHTYQVTPNTPANFKVRAEITGIYLPVDPGGGGSERVMSQTSVVDLNYSAEFNGNGSAACNACSTNEADEHLAGRTFYPLEISSSEGKWVKRFRDAVPSDYFTIAVQYGFDICQFGRRGSLSNSSAGAASFQSSVDINYSSTQFEVVWTSAPSQTISNAGTGRKNLNLPFVITSTNAGDIRNLYYFVTFRVTDAAEVQTDYRFDISREYGSTQACDGKATTNDLRVTIADKVKSGHDPNAKTVQPAAFEESGPVTLDYLIRFYNEGFSPVEGVEVKDILDSRLNPHSVQEVYFWTGADPGKKVPIDISLIDGDPTFHWKIDPSFLPPGGLPPTNGQVAQAQDWAYLSFRVNTRPGIAVGECIPNVADIIFRYGGGTEITYTQEVEACRECCSRLVTAGERFFFGDTTASNPQRLIRILDAPPFFRQTGAQEGIFDSDQFAHARLQYRECVLDSQGELRCGPVESIVVCGQSGSQTLCRDEGVTPVDCPQGLHISVIILIILLILVATLAIILGYLLSRPATS